MGRQILLASVMTLVSTTAAPIHAQTAASGRCDLDPFCPQGVTCDTGARSLSWPFGDKGMLALDGALVTASPGAAAEPLTIRTGQSQYSITPLGRSLHLSMNGRRVGTVVEGDAPASVILTLFAGPRRYIDYPEAVAAVRTYSGTCEGLF